jgi:hypothetical protein
MVAMFEQANLTEIRNAVDAWVANRPEFSRIANAWRKKLDFDAYPDGPPTRGDIETADSFQLLAALHFMEHETDLLPFSAADYQRVISECMEHQYDDPLTDAELRAEHDRQWGRVRALLL